MHKKIFNFYIFFSISQFFLSMPLVYTKEPYTVAAYFQNYSQYRPAIGNRHPFSIASTDPNLLTDIYYAFAIFGYITPSIDPENPRLTNDFIIRPTEQNDISTLYPQIQALKKQSKNDLKIILSIGGWNFNNPHDIQGVGKYTYRLFSQMVAQVNNRKQFIDSAIKYAHQYGFDGIDIDWEFPGDLSRGGTNEDFDNFILFLKEASVAFSNTSPPLILSFAAPALIPYGIQEDKKAGFFKWIAQCSQYLDRLSVMAYDYHGPFNIPKITGANAPLKQDTSPGSSLYVAQTLRNFLENGVPPQKILLGMPNFGHSYAGVTGLSQEHYGPGKPFTQAGIPGPATKIPGLLAYFEIADLIAKKELYFSTDAVTTTAVAYNIQTQSWVSFDTPETIKHKAELVPENHLKGVIFWTLDDDEYYWEPKFPNIKSARSVLFRENAI